MCIWNPIYIFCIVLLVRTCIYNVYFYAEYDRDRFAYLVAIEFAHDTSGYLDYQDQSNKDRILKEISILVNNREIRYDIS